MLGLLNVHIVVLQYTVNFAENPSRWKVQSVWKYTSVGPLVLTVEGGELPQRFGMASSLFHV